MRIELRYYQAQDGQRPFMHWLGGDKRTQQKDIDRAKEYFEDYKTRTAQDKWRGS
jgi:putative component of toxin-antitoxin plasmid stabilization module